MDNLQQRRPPTRRELLVALAVLPLARTLLPANEARRGQAFRAAAVADLSRLDLDPRTRHPPLTRRVRQPVAAASFGGGPAAPVGR